ncbi:MAG: PLP-dependent aminotransferase family protein [Eubacterium sp.]|nr:PLP-dependent aminotransferase family protein [Eubacterium sp.]
MSFIISDRMTGVEGSMIRELFKLGADPSVISFGGGNPSAETFPVKEIEEIASKVLKENPVSVLQYGLTEGYTPLRETLKAYLSKKEGFDFEKNELFIVSGGQQCADIATKVLVNDGDVVLTEDPAFIGCLNTFRTYNAKLVGIPMESDGMDINALEEALKTNKNVKMLYTIPSFQNPTGITTSLEKRKKVYELCSKYDIAIFEDNPYGELRFAGENVPTLKSMDKDGRVLYAGSFSKVMAPAVRLGYLVFNKEILSPVTVAKQATDVHSNVLFQYICNEYMTKYDFEGHLEKCRSVYKAKADLMLSEIKKNFNPKVTYSVPEGGLFMMAFLPDGKDAYPFVREGIERKVLTVPGVAFSADPSKKLNGFRLNYSTPSDEQIVKGIEILGKLTNEWC